MAQLTEPNQVGKREDLSDVIANVDMHSTPLTTMIPKGSDLKNSLFTWQADAYDTPSTAGVTDGTDVSTFTNPATARAEISGRVQWVRRDYRISKLAENLADVAGVNSEKARAIAKRLVELKRDIEAVICSDNDSQADNGTDPYLTRGLGSWIANGAQSDLPVAAAFRTPTASIDATVINSVVESTLNGVMESIWGETGTRQRMVFLVGSGLKKRITTFQQYDPGVSSSIAAVRTFNHSAESKKITASVEFYAGDFGELEIVLSNWLASGTSNAPTRRGYILDMDTLQLRFKQRPAHMEIPDDGGGPRGVVDAIFGLCVKNPLGLGKFHATADSGG